MRAFAIVLLVLAGCAEGRLSERDGTGSAAGDDPRSPDAGSGSCECTSGPCCDGCNLLPSSSACGIDPVATEFQCSSAACGADAESREQYQYCSGASAECGNDNLVWEDWQVIEDCGADAVCDSDGTSASCTTCASGCQSGECACAQGANVAPNAVAAYNSGSTSSLFFPDKMNDGAGEESCGFSWFHDQDPQIGWIELTWSTPQELWGFDIDTSGPATTCQFAANRTVGSGTVQWWDGSAWVTDGTVTGQTDDWGYQFQTPVVTTKLRLYDASGSSQINPLVFEWQAYSCSN